MFRSGHNYIDFHVSKTAAPHLTSNKSDPPLSLFFFQARNCFEKITEIEPGKEKTVKGAENVFFSMLGEASLP